MPRSWSRISVVVALVLAAATAVFLGFGAPPTSLAKKNKNKKSAPPDVVRVGGPSAPDDSKVAVVGSAKDISGTEFTVLDDGGTTVLTGKLTRAAGSPAPWNNAALADLSEVDEEGSYTVRVGSLQSTPWKVRDDGSRKAISTILQFFAANSDGNEPSPVHGPSHLNDAVVASGPLDGQRIDLTGGWMDAGDMLHFTQTTAFAAAVLQAAARLDPADASELNQAADVGVRWLVKAHPASGVFIAQVGDERDHDLGFRDPAEDDSSDEEGIGTRLAYPGIGGDLGGKAATALALAADRSTGSRRATYLSQARDWYAAGKAAGDTAPENSGDFYTGTAWEDDMAAGAAALFRTTGESAYRDDALQYLSQSDPENGLGWDDFAPFGAADLCGALGAPALGDADDRDTACDALAKSAQAAADVAAENAFATPGEYTWGQTATNGSGGALAALAAGVDRLDDGEAIAAGARDYMFGRNPWGASFVVGYGLNSPQHPHHWESLDGDARPEGAVVGGPAPLSDIEGEDLSLEQKSPFNTKSAAYEDRVDDYVTSEPALDYAASSILLLASLAA